MGLRKDHAAIKISDAGGGKAGVKGRAVAKDFSLGAVGKGDDGIARVAKVDGIRAIGCIKKIKLLEHGIFSRGWGLKGIDLGAGGEQGDLTRTFQLVDVSDFRRLLNFRVASELCVYPEAEVTIFKLGFEACPH